jgi:dihydropteroate synthase
VLFVTGKLAEPALRRTLEAMRPAFAFEVAVLKITVAALMTTPWIARFLQVPAGTALVVIPGLCEGDVADIAARFGVEVRKGPKDLREIPEFFGQAAVARDYGRWDIEIIAEINNAPKLALEAIVREAEYFRASGADIIDIGCTPGLPFPGLGDVVRTLRSSGMRVSVDSFEPTEIRAAVDAGAELVLSVNGTNLEVARDLARSRTRVVVIPDFGGEIETLEPSIAALERWGVSYLIDPVIEPIAVGFTRSLERYAEVRRRYPGTPMMMGVGNITELTAADSTGVNAVLIGVCQELGVTAVLTTEVIPWARGSVREIDVARRLMRYAVEHGVPPKRIDDRLVTIKDAKILAYSEDELRALQSQITDANYRIFADGRSITVFNRDRFVRGTDIQEIFLQLDVGEPTHAFYLGKELMKAKLAITLGKTYRQEGSLSWGYLTPPDDVKSEHVTLTQRSARTRSSTSASVPVPASVPAPESSARGAPPNDEDAADSLETRHRSMADAIESAPNDPPPGDEPGREPSPRTPKHRRGS